MNYSSVEKQPTTRSRYVYDGLMCLALNQLTTTPLFATAHYYTFKYYVRIPAVDVRYFCHWCGHMGTALVTERMFCGDVCCSVCPPRY